MRTLVILLMMAVFATAEEPDFKALYLQANDAAARWKARAETLEKELTAQRAALADLQVDLRIWKKKAGVSEEPPRTIVDGSANAPDASYPEPASSGGPKTVQVRGYTRSDGRQVAPHTRSAPSR